MSSLDPIHDGELSPELETALDSCVKVFMLQGFQHATLEDLAIASGTSRDFIEGHFATKEQFCAAALRWYFAKFYRQLRSVLALHSEIYPAVEAVLYEFIELSREQYVAGTAMRFHTLMDIAGLDPDLSEELRKMKLEGLEHFIYKFSECEKELINPGEAKALAQYFATIFEGISIMVQHGMSHDDLYKMANFSMEVLANHLKKGSNY
ncbi:transcriptional regulator, TetR family [Pseudovibrio denitrificans]|uniref:Transcriptional regulator, TetR family n=2 Tax=Pseudovibrio denitrificans TaxID=258256 RepID=A0A1I6XVK1_9HYPH|nr:transcriptional regulator, TetR family [Pseudovibrio denitrificans]